MLARLKVLADRLNTHHVGWGGVAVAIASLAIIGGRAPLDAWTSTYFHGFSAFPRALIDGAATVGLFIVWPAIVAAWLGRPPNISGGPAHP